MENIYFYQQNEIITQSDQNTDKEPKPTGWPKAHLCKKWKNAQMCAKLPNDKSNLAVILKKVITELLHKEKPRENHGDKASSLPISQNFFFSLSFGPFLEVCRNCKQLKYFKQNRYPICWKVENIETVYICFSSIIWLRKYEARRSLCW